jgi:hypothetical protein
VLVVFVVLAIVWIFTGQKIAGFIDRHATVEIESKKVNAVGYNGTGDGGTLTFDNREWALTPLNPHVGSTKDNQLAVASGGKVFAIGALFIRGTESVLLARVADPDRALLKTRRSYVPWLVFGGGEKLHLDRKNYYQLVCQKADGSKLEMLWSGDLEKGETTLIRVEISNASG